MDKEMHIETKTESLADLARITDRINQSASLSDGNLFAQLSDATSVDKYNASIKKTDEMFSKLKERVDSYCVALNELDKAKDKANEDSRANAFFLKFENTSNMLGEKELAKIDGFIAKKDEILKSYAERRVAVATWELSSMLALAKTEEQIVTSRTNVVNKAYSSMGDQMRKYVELHQFSGKAFAAAVTEQVKTELLGIAAKSAVWALFETAMGFATLMTPAVSAAHFTAAGEFAVVSTGAIAGAMGVQWPLSKSLSSFNVESESESMNPAIMNDDGVDIVLLAA